MIKSKDTPALAIFAGAFAVFLLTPYFPTALINILVGYRLTAFLAIATTAYVFKKNMLQGLALFLAFSALFLEYRRRKIEAIRISFASAAGSKTKKMGAPISEAGRPAAPLVNGEIHPRFQIPSVEEHDYEPGNGDNSLPSAEELETYDSAIENEKNVIETVSSQPSETASFFRGLGLGLGSTTNA